MHAYSRLLDRVKDISRLRSVPDPLDLLRAQSLCHGKRYRAGDLLRRVTGAPLSTTPFMNYVTEKLSEVYEL